MQEHRFRGQLAGRAERIRRTEKWLGAKCVDPGDLTPPAVIPDPAALGDDRGFHSIDWASAAGMATEEIDDGKPGSAG